MSMWQRIRRVFGGERPGGEAHAAPPRAATSPVTRAPVTRAEDEPEMVVPELSVEELRTALSESAPPLVIDVREPYEWRLVRIPMARHIPMNDVPDQLDTLPRDQHIVVLCAHGSRSYSVAAWLIEEGFDAASLAGGITQWAHQGGPVEQGEVAAR